MFAVRELEGGCCGQCPTPCASLPPCLSLGEAAADEDPAQGVLLAAHGHRWADVQVAEGVEARGASERDFLGYVSKVGALWENQQDAPTPRRKGQLEQENHLYPLFTDPPLSEHPAIQVQANESTITRKAPSVWKLGDTLLQNLWATDYIQVDTGQSFEQKGNKNTAD